MNARNVQIKAMYEQGMQPEQIVEVFPELSVDAVKICLMGCSARYRQAIKQDEALFGEDAKLRARMLVEELMDDPDTPHTVKLKAARFVIDEVKGRNDVKAVAKVAQNVNVNLFNLHLAKVEERYQKAKMAKVIELPKEDQELLKAE